MLTLRGEKTALWKAWRRKDQTFYQCALECRAIGAHWTNIKSIITARRKAGEDITIQKWATQHAPVSVRWLNEYSEFANRWAEFLETWRWSQSTPYSPERKAGLHTFQDLMLAKQRYDSVSRARQTSFGGRGARITGGSGNSVPKTGTGTIGGNRAIDTDCPAHLRRRRRDAETPCARRGGRCGDSRPSLLAVTIQPNVGSRSVLPLSRNDPKI